MQFIGLDGGFVGIIRIAAEAIIRIREGQNDAAIAIARINHEREREVFEQRVMDLNGYHQATLENARWNRILLAGALFLLLIYIGVDRILTNSKEAGVSKKVLEMMEEVKRKDGSEEWAAIANLGTSFCIFVGGAILVGLLHLFLARRN